MRQVVQKTLLLGLLLIRFLSAQSVGIETSAPDASARLDITSSNQGVLIPRVSLTSVTEWGDYSQSGYEPSNL